MCVALAAWAAPVAHAVPTTTAERTIQDCDADNLLEFAAGERHVPFPEEPFPPDEACTPQGDGGSPLRLPREASLLNLLQLTDFQMVDEESPARVEWLDGTQRFPGLQPFAAAYRPQESLTTQVTEAMVRQARNTVSPVTGAQLDLAILTGDNADSQQYNETRWFIDELDGTTGPGDPDPEMTAPSGSSDRKLDPNSGIPTPGCAATPGSVYDGVRDGGVRDAPDPGYYEPDSSSPPDDDGDGYSPDRARNAGETGRDVTVRDFPGLLERANERFESVGLGLPWYSAFGNHDALVQGNSPEAYLGPLGPSGETFDPAFHALATGCVKVTGPSPATAAAIDVLQQEIEDIRQGELPGGQAEIEEKIGAILALANDTLTGACDPSAAGCDFDGTVETVPPDPRRCFLAKDDNALALPAGLAPGPCSTGSWIRQHFRTTGAPVGHGFAPTAAADCARYGSEQAACEGALSDADRSAGLGRPPQAVANHDGYYSFVPRHGFRFLVLDTITDECGSEFCSDGSVDATQFQWLSDQIDAAAAAGQYVVVFSHHTLRTTRFPTTDPEEAPAHYGLRIDQRSPGNPQNPSGLKTLEELYCDHPNVLAHVAGHEHENYVQRHDCRDNPSVVDSTRASDHFWHVSTAAHVDWPQQSRMIELVTIDGDLSLVLTVLDHGGPANPGGQPEQTEQGRAPADVTRLASIAREIAYNDYQGNRVARGTRHDRNVILPTGRPAPE
ncbi:MAG TPA: hypothetical protein VF520_16440 [Thermoleophilaceae bacterium]